MSSRPSLIAELARMMIKQAKLLKAQGLLSEAREIARGALEIRQAQLQPIPVRARRRR